MNPVQQRLATVTYRFTMPDMAICKRGDIIDIKGDGAIHKGKTHKFYHGKTGRIFNVTPHAVGVEANKQVGNGIIPKKINVRIEHIKQSNCRLDFLKRVKRNEALNRAAKEKGVMASTKRVPAQPRKAYFVSTKLFKSEFLAPIPYEIIA
ncbi:unnamed protein product [Candidula unifasciata]|uniref:Large ribosomal subunit protein eL21 n=1 Tax=Candidula unifasciata TaxID=100452 RepID=A0A8S3ZCR7_9EUPU|nr:unnamed protein product [Candidula unifasciata]